MYNYIFSIIFKLDVVPWLEGNRYEANFVNGLIVVSLHQIIILDALYIKYIDFFRKNENEISSNINIDIQIYIYIILFMVNLFIKLKQLTKKDSKIDKFQIEGKRKIAYLCLFISSLLISFLVILDCI